MDHFDVDRELESAAAACGALHASLWVADPPVAASRCVAATPAAGDLAGAYATRMDRWLSELGWRLPERAVDVRTVPAGNDADGREGAIVLAWPMGDGGARDTAPAEDLGARVARWRALRGAARLESLGREGPGAVLALHQSAPGALERLRALLDAEAAAVFAIDPAAGCLRCVDTAGPLVGPLLGTGVALGEGILGDVVVHRRCVRVSDTSLDPRFLRGVDQMLPFRATSVACAPVPREGAVVGAVHLVNRAAPRGDLAAFDAADEAWLRLAAIAIGAAVRR